VKKKLFKAFLALVGSSAGFLSWGLDLVGSASSSLMDSSSCSFFAFLSSFGSSFLADTFLAVSDFPEARFRNFSKPLGIPELPSSLSSFFSLKSLV
jgi:hypothetical protein